MDEPTPDHSAMTWEIAEVVADVLEEMSIDISPPAAREFVRTACGDLAETLLRRFRPEIEICECCLAPLVELGEIL